MRTDRGIAIITTLIMGVIVLMLVTAGLALLPSQRMMSGTIDENQRALTAAEAGIEYARTQLQANPEWSATSDSVVIDEPGTLWVREDKGNVVGIVWSSDGEPSLFRLRFNFQNGTGAPDESLEDPAPEMFVNHPYISFNGLNQAASGPIWRSESSGNYEVNSSESFGDVPRFCAVLYCEGLAGTAVREISPSSLEIDTTDGTLTRRVVEAMIGRDVSEYGDSVLYGASDINLRVEDRLLVESASEDVPPRARTLGDVLVSSTTPNPLSMEDGEVLVNQATGKFTVNGVNSVAPAATRSDSSGSFLELGWSQIDKAQTSDAKVNAGTYVWEDIGGKTELTYYDVEYDPADPSTNPLLPPLAGTGRIIKNPDDMGVDVGKAISFKRAKMEFSVAGNVLIEPTSKGSTGLSVLVSNNVLTRDRDRPKVEFKAKRKHDPDPILTSPGKVQMMGNVHGSGAITAEGDITVQGESVLRTGPDTQVALYSKRDITIKPIPTQVLSKIASSLSSSSSAGSSPYKSSFTKGVNPFLDTESAGDVMFSGVVYAQGSFSANIGASNNFHLRGVLVAYGGDPEAGETPGERGSGSGAVSIQSRNTQLIYDSSFVSTLINQSGAVTLNNLSWRWF